MQKHSRSHTQTGNLSLGNYGFVFTVVLLCFICASLSSSYVSLLVLLTIACVTAVVVLNDNTLTSPVSMMALFYYPYSTWRAYFNLFTDGAYSDVSLFGQLYYCLLGLLGLSGGALFIVVVSRRAKTSTKRKGKKNKRFRFKETNKAVKLILIVMAPIVVFAGRGLSDSGASTKTEVYENLGLLGTLALTAFPWIAYSISYYAIVKGDRKITLRRMLSDPYIMVTLALAIMGVLFFAKRDFLFRVLFGIAGAYAFHRRNIGWPLLAVGILAVSILVPIVGDLRGTVLASSNSEVRSLTWEIVFANEFHAPGRNLETLLYYGVEHDSSYLLNELLRAVLSPFGDELMTSSQWFNEIYRPKMAFNDASGWGFTMVGTGYVAGGALGVFAVMFFMSVVLQILYQKRFKSTYWYCFYLAVIVSSIYCIRTDLSSFLSNIKIAAMVSGSFWIYESTLAREGRKLSRS